MQLSYDYCVREAFPEAPIFTKMIIQDIHEFITACCIVLQKEMGPWAIVLDAY